MKGRVILAPAVCRGCRRRLVLWRDSLGHISWRTAGSLAVHRCNPVERCGFLMPIANEPCARIAGHGYEHRTAYALDNANAPRTAA